MSSCVIVTYGALLIAQLISWLGLGQKCIYKPWYLFFLIAVIGGYACDFLNLFAILYIVIFGLCCYYYQRNKTGFLAIAVIGLALPLFLHYSLIGFNNYMFLDHIRITDNAYPYSLYFNFDKTLIGIFMLGFSTFNLNKEQLKTIVDQFWKHLLIMTLVVLGASLLISYINFEPKLPQFTLVWALINLFFVCISEEVLFRGIIQQELGRLITCKYSNTIAILIAALLFGLMHFSGGIYYILLATICGLFYGHIYFKTKEIRSSIVLHFCVNFIHFLLFTYPALQR